MSRLYGASVLSSFLMLATNVFAAEPKIVASAQLNPLGDFTIESTTLQGRLEKKGDGFTAKELQVPIDSLKTSQELRDEHMHQRLGWPEVKTIAVRDITAQKTSGHATILINKIAKPVAFKVTKNDDQSASVVFTLSLKDFKIERVRYLNVGVEDEITVEATIPYDAKKPK